MILNPGSGGGKSGVNDKSLPAKAVAVLAGLDPAPYRSFDDLVGDQEAMRAVSASEAAILAVTVSPEAVKAVAASKSALAAVGGVDYAATKFAAGAAGLITSNYSKPIDVAEDEAAMKKIATCPLAVAAIIASPAMLGEVAKSEKAMAAIISEPEALAAVIASEAAMTAIVSSGGKRAITSRDDVMREIGKSSMASAKLIISECSGLNIDDYDDFDAVAASKEAMAAISANDTALGWVGFCCEALYSICMDQDALNMVKDIQHFKSADSTVAAQAAAKMAGLDPDKWTDATECVADLEYWSAVKNSEAALNALKYIVSTQSAVRESPLIVKYQPENYVSYWRDDLVYSGSGIFVWLSSYGDSGNTCSLDGGAATEIQNGIQLMKAFQKSLRIHWICTNSNYAVYYIPC